MSAVPAAFGSSFCSYTHPVAASVRSLPLAAIAATRDGCRRRIAGLRFAARIPRYRGRWLLSSKALAVEIRPVPFSAL